MSERKKGDTRTRYDSRRWIIKALESGSREGMLTPEIVSAASTLNGSVIPKFAIYSALRTLQKRKQVTSERRGQSLLFKLVRTAPEETPQRNVVNERSALASPVAVIPAPSTAATQSLHKLAPGEAVILHIGTEHIETATNVHGKVVLEKHLRTK